MALGTAGTAHAAEVEGWTGMGAQLPPQNTLTSASIASLGADSPSPSGANEACTPAPGENPVVLIHGMNANAYTSWAGFAPDLKAQGKCVYALNYGTWEGNQELGSSLMGKLPGFGGLAPLQDSLAEVTQQIQLIKANTGADTVDLVGYSEGGTLATAYAKQTDGQDVGTVVTVSGVVHGTSMLGLAALHREMVDAGIPVDTAVNGILGPVGEDLLEDSPFMVELNRGGVEVPGVHYVAVSTNLDEAATPLSNSQFSGGDHENYVVQDGCVSDVAGHLGTPYDPRAKAIMINALGRNIPVPCSSAADRIPQPQLSSSTR